jgi:hypothetical protein
MGFLLLLRATLLRRGNDLAGNRGEIPDLEVSVAPLPWQQRKPTEEALHFTLSQYRRGILSQQDAAVNGGFARGLDLLHCPEQTGRFPVFTSGFSRRNGSLARNRCGRKPL